MIEPMYVIPVVLFVAGFLLLFLTREKPERKMYYPVRQTLTKKSHSFKVLGMTTNEAYANTILKAAQEGTKNSCKWQWYVVSRDL